MEALGAASAIISVTQLTGKVISIIYDYQRGARHASKQINAVKRELQQLRDVLERLEDLASDDENQATSFDAIAGPLQACKVELERLETVLTSEKGRFGKLGQALKWPLKEKEVKECLDILAGQRSVLQLALTADQSTLMLAIRDEVSKSDRHVTDLNDSFKSFTIDDHREKITNWLNAPDPSFNHNKACQARQPKTGLWLLNGSEYQRWKTETDKILWLHGIPGCGKTILSSTVIENLATLRRSRPKSLLLYYYFDFNDIKKQEVDMFLRSMVSQIVWQQERVSVSLKGLYERYDRGGRQPARDLLLTTLRDNLRDSAETFIVLDALDECKELQPLLAVIALISDSQIPTLHIACTSRRERHIVEVFDQLHVIETSIQNEQVDADIGLLVDDQLEHDPQLQKWSVNLKGEIRTALARGSQGMFRWAVCQLDALKNCLKPATLRQALRTLPRTLDETYERILKDVKGGHLEDVLKMLRWLIYAEWPLTLGELAEAVAISVDDTPIFDSENRLRHPIDLLHLCSTLVSLTRVDRRGRVKDNPIHCVVRLAHYSVQEYLLSKFGVSDSQISLSFEQSAAQAYIGKACLTYLLYLDRILAGRQYFSREAVQNEYVLYDYSATYWNDHAMMTDATTGTLLQEMFFSETAFIIWTHGYNTADLYTKADTYVKDNSDHDEEDSDHDEEDFDHDEEDFDHDEEDFDHDEEDFDDVEDFDNDKDIAYLDQRYYRPGRASNHYCKAIYVASYCGFTDLVKKLVDQVEDVNLVLGYYGTALGAAALQGQSGVLQVLLEHGAKPDIEFGDPCFLKTSLQAAVYGGHVECTRLLIAAGSCVNHMAITSGWHCLPAYRTPLSVAARFGHTDVLQVLIEKGADVNAIHEGGFTCMPLLEAAHDGHAEIVQVLLKNGANVNHIEYQSDYRALSTPLLAAVVRGDLQMAKMLIENGADVNLKIPDDEDPTVFHTHLLAAVKRGHKEVIQLLLANGADVKFKGEHGNARETALHNGRDDIAALLPSSD